MRDKEPNQFRLWMEGAVKESTNWSGVPDQRERMLAGITG